MIEKVMQIQLPTVLEARPVAMLVQVASKHDCSVYIEMGDKKVNAKSIMGMMSLGLSVGETVTVIADGSDEKKAVEEMEEYLIRGKVS